MSYQEDEDQACIDFQYNDLENSPQNVEKKPRIQLMGLHRSGKSSIQKVVFHKMSPSDTLFLEATNEIVEDDINNSFIQFQIWDFPGQINYLDQEFNLDRIFGDCGCVVFVIDIQDEFDAPLAKLHDTVTKAYKVNPRIKFEVFIHKVDGLGDDFKMQSQREIHQRATESLAEADLEHIHLSFHLTSIYDHSIFEAFSKVVQKLIPQLPTLENLLNILISNSGIEKAFLFDVVSKIYIATDCAPVDMQSYELSCDMIDVVMDLSSIYGFSENTEEAEFDSHSSSLIKMNNSWILYLREVNKFLALVCILREDNFNKQGVIDYNFLCFRKAIERVFELKMKNNGMVDSLSNGGDDEDVEDEDDHHLNDSALYTDDQTVTNYGSITNSELDGRE